MAKKRYDGQLTGMAGEFLTVGKLFKKGYQAAVTFGNAKSVDVIVYNPETERNFCVQVKTLRHKNCFLINKDKIIPEHIYVFIFLNNWEEQEEFFILTGEEILEKYKTFFGSSYKNPNQPSKMPAINYGPLAPYKNNWEVFER
ncbi:MAG: hypothetical protein QM449_05835 [Synergistota bacterium]|nr:hypothetical protein [Synergistota bacterium]